MTTFQLGYAALLAFTAVAVVPLGIHIWRLRAAPGATAAGLFVITAAVRQLIGAIEIVVPNEESRLVLFQVRQALLSLLPVFWCWFGLRFVGLRPLAFQSVLGTQTAVSLVTIVLIATSSFHELMWSHLMFRRTELLPLLELDRGPWFWIAVTVSYGFMIATTAAVIVRLLRSPDLFQSQANVVIIGTATLFVGNAVSLIVLLPRYGIDLGPITITLGIAVFAYGLFRYRLLDVRPAPTGTGIHELPDPIFAIDRRGRIVDLSWPARIIAGGTGRTVVGESLADLLPGLPAGSVAAEAPGASQEITITVAGEVRVFDIRRAESGAISDITLVALRDITGRKQAERALQENEARYRGIVENARSMIYSRDLDGRVQAINRAAEVITGFSHDELMAMNLRDYVVPEQRTFAQSMVDRLSADEPSVAYQVDIVSKSGRRITLEVTNWLAYQDGQPVAVQGIARDVTDRVALEERLRQAEKMEAVGQLAGGVAHDFNNLLTGINGFSALLLETMQPDDPGYGYVSEIKKAGEQAAELTRQLLAFGRRQMLRPTVINVNEVVNGLATILGRLIGEDIELRLSLDPTLDRILADETQIQQVVLNLAVNARDAMPDGGLLTIETENVMLDSSYSAGNPEVSDGRYAMLAISDTGHGMDEATRAHIFEPFFTTKEQGKGTGLGLSTVYGIVKQSGGHIAVYSEPGQGTSFKVFLPATGHAETPPKSVRIDRAGPVTVLVVDDEEVARRFVSEALGGERYTVLAADRPSAALRLVREHQGSIDVLLTDIVMPEMSGTELAGRVRDARPGIKTLFMSGYAEQAIMANGLLEAGSRFVSKPFAPEALVESIDRVIRET